MADLTRKIRTRPKGGMPSELRQEGLKKKTPMPSPREKHPKRKRSKGPKIEKSLLCSQIVIMTFIVLMSNNYWAYYVPWCCAKYLMFILSLLFQIMHKTSQRRTLGLQRPTCVKSRRFQVSYLRLEPRSRA